MPLPLGRWQVVRSFDARQITVLEDGARACPDVGDDTLEEPAPSDLGSGRQRGLKAGCGRAPRLHDVGQHSYRREVVPGLGGHVHSRLLDPHPRGTRLPSHLQVEVGQTVEAHAWRWSGRTIAVDRDMKPDARNATHPCCVECRLVGQGGRPERKNATPRRLQPRRLTRVVEVDTAREGDQVATPLESSYVMRRQTDLDQLTP
jgi:hypothetical protein